MQNLEAIYSLKHWPSSNPHNVFFDCINSQSSRWIAFRFSKSTTLLNYTQWQPSNIFTKPHSQHRPCNKIVCSFTDSLNADNLNDINHHIDQIRHLCFRRFCSTSFCYFSPHQYTPPHTNHEHPFGSSRMYQEHTWIYVANPHRPKIFIFFVL